MPQVSARTSSGHEASTSKTLSPSGVIGGVSRSNSSWIGPTSSSSTFSSVDHADDAAVLVEQHGQVDPVALELEQELVEPQRHGQERDLAGELAQVGPAVLIGPGAEDVLDVDHADDGRQVVLAEREPGVAGLAGEAEVVLERPGQAQIDDVGPRDHHPPGGLLLQVRARSRSSSARCATGGRPPRSRPR